MAIPIKDTPVIHGKDSERFNKNILNSPKASMDDVKRARELVAHVLSKSKEQIDRP
jgi:hypothetical protein